MGRWHPHTRGTFTSGKHDEIRFRFIYTIFILVYDFLFTDFPFTF